MHRGEGGDSSVASLLQNDKEIDYPVKGQVWSYTIDMDYMGWYYENMSTVVIPEKQYETLRKQASLYREVLSGVRGNFIEQYSDKRIEGFLKEDAISKKTKEKIRKFLK